MRGRETKLLLAGWLSLLGAGCGDDEDEPPDCSSACYHVPSASACGCAWDCPPNGEPPIYEIECSQSAGGYECTCIVDDAETGSFTSSDICQLEVPEPQVNDGCGWQVR